MTHSLQNQYKTLISTLIKERNADGYWSGRLASSALATAVAIVAFKVEDELENRQRIETGLTWLLTNVNADGGYGDTPESISNVSTSLLSYAAIYYCQTDQIPGKAVLSRIEQYLATQQIYFNSGNITVSILKFYGKDYTFSIPILSMLIICGVLDDKAIAGIPQLPFELTLFPNSWYGLVNMQVVSYAIPALVAVGIFVHKKRTYRLPLIKWIRNKSIPSALKKLSAMVPESGGFLEAIPLTAFVSMCLMVSNTKSQTIVNKGITFLKNQQRPDGSWPIDTDLSTWVTTLSIKAMGPDLKDHFSTESLEQTRNHLLTLQYKEKHPFNQALPGGWGWTNFSGSVPDVDDTSGAILALLELYKGGEIETRAILNGCQWLTQLQNKDGGFPTFCRGWSRLPFDSSCADLTGHSLAALIITLEKLGSKTPELQRKSFLKSIQRAITFLEKQQNSSGSWLPLWFGNQHTPNKENPVYGTAKVTTYVQDCLTCKSLDDITKDRLERMVSTGNEFLQKQQNKDGSWGGLMGVQGSMEETALAICALVKTDPEACEKGFQWLEDEFRAHGLTSSPIGLYFAALWYDEKMYPLVYYIEAIRRYVENMPNSNI
jgi:squalene-hopene/tetraprenyl-beta-curcumene cyclase